VIGAGVKLEPAVGADASSVIDAHHRLLAAYVQIVSGIDQLPFMVRRQPGGQAQSKWWSWWFGAPRFVVRSFVLGHVRRRLHALGSGLTRASLLSYVDYYGASRAELSAAADECDALAAIFPRAIWPTVAAFLVTVALPTGLTVYTAFFQAAPISVNLTVPHDPSLFIALAITLTVPFTFNRSLWCKQVMFNPGLARRSLSGVRSPLCASDVYKLEREAFLRAGLIVPVEWETRSWVTVLVLEAYIVAIFMPILFASSAVIVIEVVIATLLLSTTVAMLARNSANRAGGYVSVKKARLSVPWLR
jgi:hypothetical protein